MSTSETTIETHKCAKCGAEVRPDTQFCYNCGGSVTADNEVSENGNAGPGVPEVLQNTSVPAPGLRSARDIRRRERSFERKPKEVVWEPELKGPDVRLIVVAAIALVFTIAVIVLASYLR